MTGAKRISGSFDGTKAGSCKRIRGPSVVSSALVSLKDVIAAIPELAYSPRKIHDF